MSPHARLAILTFLDQIVLEDISAVVTFRNQLMDIFVNCMMRNDACRSQAVLLFGNLCLSIPDLMSAYIVSCRL